MSGWIDHVKNFAKENNIKYKEALKQASASYKEGKKEETKVEIPKIKKTKALKKSVEVPSVEVCSTEPVQKSRTKKLASKC